MQIKAFQGWRYHSDDGDVSSLLAPPYDILSRADKEALLAGDRNNIVGVDLPHVPPADAGPDSAYRAAADCLKDWMESGLLVRDERPSLYAYEQAFGWAGRQYCRRALVAAVRLAEFGKGVWPHEKTFPGSTADRLKLTRATGMQISPVFGFYEGDSDAVEMLFAASPDGPVARARISDVEEKLWAVSDPGAVVPIGEALRDRALFIADGHHRYAAALRYRGQFGRMQEHHPANHVMFVLATMGDPGLIILPPHRVIAGLRDFDLERFVIAARRTIAFERVELGPQQVVDADGFLRGFGPHAMAFVARERRGGGLAAYVGVLKDHSIMSQLAGDHIQAWRELDVAILHRLVIDHYLAECKTNEMFIDYVPDGRAALAAAAAGRADLVVFLQATPLQAVKEVALGRAVMPHKSTYFYPKPATGLVLYPLK